MEHNERPIYETYKQRSYQDDIQDEQSFWSPVQEVLSRTEEQIRLQRPWDRAMDVSYSSSPAGENLGKRKRQSDSSEVDEVSVKPYQCRFCPMRFSKSQALGGHMNRHRQEREQEQLTKAQQLIFQKRISSFDMPDWETSSSAIHQLKMQSSDQNSNYNIARPSIPQDLNGGLFPSASGFSWATSFSGGQTTGNVTHSFPQVGNEHVSSLLQTRQQSGSCSSLDMNTFALSQQNLSRNPFALTPDALPYETSMHTSCFPLDGSWVDLDPYNMQQTDYPNQRQVVLSPLLEKPPDVIGTGEFPDTAAATNSYPFDFLDQAATYQQAGGIQSKVSTSCGLPLENVHDFFQASKGLEAYPVEGIKVPNSSSLQALFPTTESQLGISSWMLGNQKHEVDEGFTLALGNGKFITDPVPSTKQKTEVPRFHCVEGTAKELVSISSSLSEDFASGSNMLRETLSIAASVAPESHVGTSITGNPKSKAHGEFASRFQ
ncbi:hypothetical protein O6H91_08G008600 [Diphasiastrum complanatum]|uniref:Uncharacterized protein n=2 Tax=Diphasiastrum complanatum TaxID=34168 RepID=A0ACC2CV35_DIPCM|nr:hypothetical protein O6H91_08G008600 [Diphasiastrum complanatum]KAJ7545755.1 hypothetical protein O6H91_08G008600 [Diphasiastrum complanatum]